jgi:hypothetical protein
VGKISSEAKKDYFEKLKNYKVEVERLQKRESNLLKIVETGQAGTEQKLLALADENLNLVSYFLLMNSLSVSLLGVKNEAFLNDARKGCYKAIINLEKIVSNYVDVPFSEYEEMLEKIDSLDDAFRYRLMRKLGYSIDSVVEGFGENSKWKWSFVEIQARYATVCKNMINLKTYIAGMDPRVPGYVERQAHMKLAMELLQAAADGYRQKYELSTLRLDDFKIAINYLAAIRRIHSLLGNSDESESMKKKIDIWRTKMETDLKKKEQRSSGEKAQGK